MNIREMLQMNNQIIAFNAIIKGDLDKEIEQAREALDALGSAQAIAIAQTKVDSDVANYAKYVAEMTTLFEETKEDLKNEQEKIDKAFADLKEERLVLSKAKSELVTAQDKLLNDKDISEHNLALAWNNINEATAKVKVDQEELKEALVNVAKREAKVAEKLDAIKALAK